MTIILYVQIRGFLISLVFKQWKSINIHEKSYTIPHKIGEQESRDLY